MPLRSLALVRQGLISVEHHADRIRSNVPVPETPARTVDFVAYSDQPFDARTSTIAAVAGADFGESDLELLRPLGAPVLAQCLPDHVLFWKQTAAAPKLLERVPTGKISSFFRAHREELAPSALYRAKVWSRMEADLQLDFVDAGLLPLIEQSSGEALRKLLERAVTATKSALGWKQDMGDSDGRWLLKSVFWLLAAKILKDKSVPGFARADLCHLEDTYFKLAKHYDRHDPRPVQVNGSRRRDALLSAVEIIQSFGHCGAVTTESLAWVYESALIDRATRQKFGTHSTPTWMVDDIVAKLRPWIEAMPVDDRRVYEPACGHAGFLISAMRLLSELLPKDRASERKSYLRKRLHGIEVDSFAYEVARLSLTLADVPNDNGWMLDNGDMFAGDALRAGVSAATIVLANPPFEKFGDKRPKGAMHRQADETFRQIIESLPVGGVFGIVMPQTILHSTQGKELRRKLLDEYDISAITLFADKVFKYGEPETAVILGRRVGIAKKPGQTQYRRVREDQIETYKKTLVPSSLAIVPTADFESLSGSLLVPEFAEVWSLLHGRLLLGQVVKGGKGFEHKGKNDKSFPKGTFRESDSKQDGFIEGFTEWREDQLTHELPRPRWLNLNPQIIRRGLHGLEIGKQQVLVNHARVSRSAWRLKALLDLSGHPVKGRFLVWRPNQSVIHPKALWAICNSPIANAFAYSQSSTRDVLGRTLRAMPVFRFGGVSLLSLVEAVDAYFSVAKGVRPLGRKANAKPKSSNKQMALDLPGEGQTSATDEEELKYLHWRVDAEVLRLYDMPAQAERRILDLFTGVRRRGVPFVQDEYFPKGFSHLDRLSELLAITADWEQTNKRRCDLIRKDVKGKLATAEKEELDRLERLADARIAYLDLLHPAQPDEVERTVERLKREGKWVE